MTTPYELYDTFWLSSFSLFGSKLEAGYIKTISRKLADQVKQGRFLLLSIG